MTRSLAPHRITPASLSLPSDKVSESASNLASIAPKVNPISKTCAISASSFFDLVVMGAGPAGLALVSRILESRPAALYTDQEHVYLHWLQRSRNPSLLKTRKRGAGSDWVVVDGASSEKSGCYCGGRMRILVLDKLGEGWMTNWNRHFEAFNITHLRSPLFWHPGPADLDALITFAERKGRSKSGPPTVLYSQTRSTSPRPELIEIPGCVGAEISKHKRTSRRSRQETNYARLVQNSGPTINERDRRDYFTPGTALFHDFVQEDVVQRYGLASSAPWPEAKSGLNNPHTGAITMLKGEVASLDWVPLHVEGSGHTAGFCVQTNDGACVGAKAVVCAVGMGGCPSIPPVLSSSTCGSTKLEMHGPGWAHSSFLTNPSYTFPPEYCNRGTAVVIGGGLTSAQICHLALQKGFFKVVLVLRGFMKVKPFDVSLDWIGRYSNLKKMEFWQEEDSLQRLNMLRSARNGGSITPTYAKILKMHQDRGALEILTNTSLEGAQWDDETKTWSLDIRTSDPPSSPAEKSQVSNITCDFIVSATGTTPSFSSLPFIKSLSRNSSLPVCPMVGGLPVLTSHLQWPGLPLFCVGGYSALQVGPAAFNLGGMREAADRVVERLEELAIGRDLDDEDVGIDMKATEEEVKNDYTYFDFNLLSVEG
ncbi:fad binding domain protein [Rhizoctonia solani]|uniref:Fad binding domain protein n=1 Tax=Rhizoctonia solani TaxID=456999 RepID=A0A8H7LNF5_9AGAM|nr:fad binding domain protein [Rhizoctonia solani]